MDPTYRLLAVSLAVLVIVLLIRAAQGRPSRNAQAERRLQNLQQAVDAALLWVDRSGGVVQWNHIAAKYFGADQLAGGATIDELATPDSGAPLTRRLAEYQCLSSVENAARRVRAVATGTDGQQFAARVAFYPIEGDDCCLIVVEDQTRHDGSLQELRDYSSQLLATKQALLAQNNQLEETIQLRTDELRRAKDEAEAANQVKTDFLANMSHELRTPLHGILSFSRFGLQRIGTAPTEKITGYFERINSSGAVLLRLVDQLLDMARLDAGSETFVLEPCSTTEIIEHVLKEFDSLTEERNLTIEWVAPHDTVNIDADRDKLSCVVRNLVGNAVKHSPSGGVVTVTLESDHDPVGCLITVRDQGPGIPESDLTAIFEEFFQSKAGMRSGGGTGLGLAIAQRIVHQHGGNIWASNNDAGGAAFFVSLPAHSPAASQPLQVQ